MKKNKIKSRGFTLIELLVVIAIIAFLSSIVLSSLIQARSKSRDATRVSDIKQLQTALELYRNKRGAYPTNLQDLVTDKFVAKQPTDPLGTQAGVLCRQPVTNITAGYCYSYNSTRTKYHLGAQLETTKNWSISDSQFNSQAVNASLGLPYTNGFDGSGTVGSAAYIYDKKF